MGAKQAPSQEDRAAQGPCPQRHRRCSHRHCLPGHQRAPNGCVSRAGGPAGRTTRTRLLASLSTSPNPLPATHPQPEHPRAKSRAPRSQEGSIVVPSAHSGRLLILPAGLGMWARGGSISGPWGTGGTHPPAHESGPDGSCASQGAGHTPGVSSQQLLLPNSSHPTPPTPKTSHVLLLLSAQTSGGPTAPSWRVESYHPPPQGYCSAKPGGAGGAGDIGCLKPKWEQQGPHTPREAPQVHCRAQLTPALGAGRSLVPAWGPARG